MDDASIKAVIVLTPASTILQIVPGVARAGMQVLIEKPRETDLHRANALVEACEVCGVTQALMLPHRLHESALGLAALINTGELGELVSA